MKREDQIFWGKSLNPFLELNLSVFVVRKTTFLRENFLLLKMGWVIWESVRKWEFFQREEWRKESEREIEKTSRSRFYKLVYLFTSRCTCDFLWYKPKMKCWFSNLKKKKILIFKYFLVNKNSLFFFPPLFLYAFKIPIDGRTI